MRKNTVRKKRTRPSPGKASHTRLWVFSYYAIGISVGCLLLALLILVYIFRKNALPPCANTISCVKDLSGQATRQTQGTYMGNMVQSPQQDYFIRAAQPAVLGASVPSGPKHIYIDLTNQRLSAYQGNTLMFNDSVASGKWNLTPTGTFQIWIKLRATLMAGGEGATAYYLPNVPWTMYFYNAKIPKSDGYGMHGEYWYNPDTGLGQPESHGCINMRISDAKALFDWVDPPATGYTTFATWQNPGTELTIFGTTPNQDLAGTRFYNNNMSFDAGDQL